MHLLLVGPGALGCLLATVVTKGIAVTGDRLTLLDYNAARAALLSSQGITYVRGELRQSVPIVATSDPSSVAPVDVLVLCVKSYDVTATLRSCAPLLREQTLVLFLQNGIGHLDALDHLGAASAAFGTTTEGATLLGPGQVRHAGSGLTYLGFLGQAPAALRQLLGQLQAVFAAGGLLVHQSDEILSRIWAKLFINVGINALTATLDCKNGELLTLPKVEVRMARAVAEAKLVAEAEGIALVDDPLQATKAVCQKTADNISSMLQDVRKKRRTEIDAINGAIVKKGAVHRIATPENRLLFDQVKEIEARYGKER